MRTTSSPLDAVKHCVRTDRTNTHLSCLKQKSGRKREEKEVANTREKRTSKPKNNGKKRKNKTKTNSNLYQDTGGKERKKEKGLFSWATKTRSHLHQWGRLARFCVTSTKSKKKKYIDSDKLNNYGTTLQLSVTPTMGESEESTKSFWFFAEQEIAHCIECRRLQAHTQHRKESKVRKKRRVYRRQSVAWNRGTQ